MNLYDVRFNILLSLDAEALDLHNASVLDKMSDKIMSDVVYWKQMYEKHGGKLPKLRYYKARHWIVAFEKEMNVVTYAELLFDFINEHDVTSEHENLHEIQFNSDDVPFTKVLKDTGVNMYMINKYHNKCLCDKLDNAGYIDDEDDYVLICSIGLYKDGYNLSLLRNDKVYEPIIVSGESVKKILYRLMKHGVIPSGLDGHEINLLRLKYPYDYSSDSDISFDSYEF